MATAQSTRRRWFQFSTLALLIAIMLIGFVCALARRSVLDEQTTVEFNAQPLSDVLAYLSIKHHYGCQIDDAVIAKGGIALDTIMITETVTDMPLRDLLERLLEPHGLAFHIASGDLVITACDQAGSWPWWRRRPTKDINSPDWP
jgi:hypothetical protein